MLFLHAITISEVSVKMLGVCVLMAPSREDAACPEEQKQQTSCCLSHE